MAIRHIHGTEAEANQKPGRYNISLYLTISETKTENLPTGWEVTVNFTLFMYNHIHDNYFTVQILKC